MTWIPETFIRALCWTLLHSLWQGFILAIVAGIVMVLTKRARSTTRYTALSLLVLAFLVVSACTFIRESAATAAGAQPPSQMTTFTGAATATVPDNMAGSPAIVPGDVATSPATIPDNIAAQPQRVTVIGQLVRYFNTHASFVVVVWFIVFLARFVNLLSGLVYAQRIRHYQTRSVGSEWQERLAALLQRLRITRPVVFLESALIKVPVVIGWLKPAILVPAGMLAQLPPEQVESILLHELAHISRRDYLFNLLQHLIDTLFFFNPALLWVSSLIRQERENCCDDVAIRETKSRRRLVQALVSFHEYQQSSSSYAIGFAGQDNSLLKRVERIVHKKNHSLNAGERAVLMGAVMLLCGAFITISGNPRVAGEGKADRTVHTDPATRVAKNEAVEPAIGIASKSQTRAIRGQRSQGLRHDPAPARILSALDTTPPAGTMTKADVDLLIRAHEHGVTTEFIDELKNMGYTVSLEQAVRLVDHGVSLSFIQRVRALGFPDLTLDQAVTLIDHGVTADFIEKWKKKTGSKLELRDYIKLQDAGVQSD
ncbi:MAG TPA: M56 family metallopeptidase [Puia sp.]|nr:M56 family metallopeptidase [Puia sp.]